RGIPTISSTSLGTLLANRELSCDRSFKPLYFMDLSCPPIFVVAFSCSSNRLNGSVKSATVWYGYGHSAVHIRRRRSSARSSESACGSACLHEWRRNAAYGKHRSY